MTDTVRVPLAVYPGGQRKIIGYADVGSNGEATLVVTDEIYADLLRPEYSELGMTLLPARKTND